MLADRFPAMCSTATLTIVVSRNSMKAANGTVTASSQGLVARGAGIGTERVVLAISASFLHAIVSAGLDRDIDIGTHSKSPPLRCVGIEKDLYGDALHDFETSPRAQNR